MIAPRLFNFPIVGLVPDKIENANALLVEWNHRLGPVNRPFGMEGYVRLWRYPATLTPQVEP